MSNSSPDGATASNKSHAATRRSSASAARLSAVQGLYEIELSGTKVDDLVLEHMRQRWTVPPIDAEEGVDVATPDAKLFKILVYGITSHVSSLDEMLEGALTRDNAVTRLDSVLRSILRAAVYELSQRTETPARVIIDEYVELAKAFYEGREPDLVNGVLDRLGRVLRGSEMDTPQGEHAAK